MPMSQFGAREERCGGYRTLKPKSTVVSYPPMLLLSIAGIGISGLSLRSQKLLGKSFQKSRHPYLTGESFCLHVMLRFPQGALP